MYACRLHACASANAGARVLSFSEVSSASLTKAVATWTSTALNTSSKRTTSLWAMRLRAKATRASPWGFEMGSEL
eukprot:Skav233735  [mRNA]  locus=scaffold2225:210896:212285:- [translate_table: standard]